MVKGNRTFLLLAFSAALLTILSSGVLAFYLDFQRGANQIITWVEDIIGPFAFVILGGGEYLFERLLFLAVILTITYLVLRKVPVFKDKTGATWVVAVAVSILAVRFGLQWDTIQTVFLPYTVLGIALTAAIPFVIYFFFVNSFEDDSDEKIFFIGIRKILWIFLAVIYFGIWMSRYDEVGGLSWIYFWTAMAAMVFMFADGTIRRLKIKHDLSQLDITNRDNYEREIRRALQDLENDHTNYIVTDVQYKRLKKKLQHRMELIKKT
ncbi:hypothetical protein J4447_00510 [Candidatus Pacearchaeota archaeon]|nr:hypothetical protein [Candidatus Pacearchaeota archaeon]